VLNCNTTGDNQWSIFKWLHWYFHLLTPSRNLYIVALNYQLLIVIVYWLLLSGGAFDDSPIEWFFNIWKHGIVCLTILIDFTLNRIPIYASQWTTPFIIAVLYLVWGLLQTVIYPGFFAYFFFDLSKLSRISLLGS
jgi:hypothetical protein